MDNKFKEMSKLGSTHLHGMNDIIKQLIQLEYITEHSNVSELVELLNWYDGEELSRYLDGKIELEQRYGG